MPMISTGTGAMLYPKRSSVQQSLAERRWEGVLCLMIMDHVTFDREPPANLTTLVMAFGGWIDAGRAATGALRHLTRDLGAARLARRDTEGAFVGSLEGRGTRWRAGGAPDSGGQPAGHGASRSEQ